jgi:hypothetical protein
MRRRRQSEKGFRGQKRTIPLDSSLCLFGTFLCLRWNNAISVNA